MTPEPTPPYRSNSRTEWLPTSSLDAAFLKKLFDILYLINEESTRLEVAALVKQANQSDDDFEELKKYAANLCKLKVSINGSKGQFFLSEYASVFDSPNFPDLPNTIIFDNSLDFNLQVKRNPRNSFKVEFDFTKPLVLDLTTNPSMPTPNKSTISVQGENEQWVEWAFGKVKSSMDARRTNRGWLHLRYHIYDLFIWFLIIPLALWNLYKAETRYAAHLRNVSVVLQLTIYIYAFLLILFVFRIIFNYSRWVFPYLEWDTPIRTGATRHRITLMAILTGLLVLAVTDFIKYIVPHLF